MMFSIVVEKYNSSFVKIRGIYEVLKIISNHFTFMAENYQFHPAYKQGSWDGKIRMYDLTRNLFPIGLLSKLDYFIKQNPNYEVAYTKFDKSRTVFSYKKIEEIIKPYNHFEGRDYQIEGIEIGLRERNCVLLSPTATGKSFILYNIANITKKMGLKTLIIVPSIQLVTQLVGDFDDYSRNCETPFSVDCHKIYGGQEKHTFKQVVISTYQSLMNLKPEYFKQFGALLVDECHTGSTEGKVIKRLVELCSNTEYKIGMSGTLDNEKLNEFSIIGMYGNIYKLTTVKKEVARGNLSPFLINRVNIKYPEAIRKQFREDFLEVKAKLDAEKFICKDTKVGAKLYSYEIDYINKLHYKYNLIKKIALKQNGNTLILFKRNETMGFKLHQKLIDERSGHQLHLVYGKVSIEERERIRAILEQSNNNIVCANFKVFGTGINIKNIHNIILAESIKTKITLFQSIGRGLRICLLKDMLNVYDICDDLSIEDFENYCFQHFEDRLNLYKAEEYETKCFNYDVSK